jgi:plasmid stabilization system protein ParE
MRFDVRLTPDALADLEEIHDWIALHDSPARAANVEDRILYSAERARVDVYLIADGRRDMQTLRSRRLVGAP